MAMQRAMTYTQLSANMSAGNTLRLGTVIRSRFPHWQWQLFSPAGEFIGAVRQDAVKRYVAKNGDGVISEEKGVNNERAIEFKDVFVDGRGL